MIARVAHVITCYRLCLMAPDLRSMPSARMMAGSRWLRGNLARKMAKQTASAVELMHSAGVGVVYEGS